MRGRLTVGGAFSVMLAALVLGAAPPAGSAAPAWKVVASASNPSATLSGVSCSSPTACVAVGELGNDTATSKAFIESWNGRVWAAVPSPSPKGSWLFGVSCVAANWCQAVGWAQNTGLALFMHWNGHGWAITSSPDPGSGTPNGVSCVSRTWCVAVGEYLNTKLGLVETRIESWNGHAWSIVPSPNRGKFGDSLRAVSCATRTSCAAVGEYFLDGVGGPSGLVVESWNGKAWSVVPNPNPVPTNEFQQFDSVSCGSPTWCVAVGVGSGDRDGGVHRDGFIESWNGHTWSAVPSRLPSNQFSGFGGVSCVSASACQVVGDHEVGEEGASRTLVESWNGRAWSVGPSPNVGAGGSGLGAVSCARATACEAIGTPNESYG